MLKKLLLLFFITSSISFSTEANYVQKGLVCVRNFSNPLLYASGIAHFTLAGVCGYQASSGTFKQNIKASLKATQLIAITTGIWSILPNGRRPKLNDLFRNIKRNF